MDITKAHNTFTAFKERLFAREEKNIFNMTEDDFRKIPHRKGWDDNIGAFQGLVILPAKRDRLGEIKYRVKCAIAKIAHTEPPHPYECIGHLHDSQFYCLDFVACDRGKPIVRLSGCSDVIHFDGIGGYGKDLQRILAGIPDTNMPSGWNIDCLPGSRLLRIFCNGDMTCGPSLSSFEIYANKTPIKKRS